MDSLAPSRPAAAELERPTPTARHLARGLPQPEHPPGVRRGPPPSRRLARRPALEDATLAAYLAELHDQGRAPARARLAGKPSPAGERTAPGSSPATGGPAAIAAEGRRGRSGRRTSPPSSPPATSPAAVAAAASPRRSPSSAAASTP